MSEGYGDRGWYGLVEGAKAVPDVADGALAQGVRRCRRLAASRPEMEGFEDRLKDPMSELRPLTPLAPGFLRIQPRCCVAS